MKKGIYGYELILDIEGCNNKLFTEDYVELFCKELCKEINMEAEDFHIWASDPKDYDTDPEHLHGVSAVQFITTSSIVIHTITKMGVVYLNLFSCKEFNKHKAIMYSLSSFQGNLLNETFIERFK